ncbi:hypothetical protein Hdeb2414_s0016g00488941 [Helianthus debilis subsp. tardiflorus]
MLESSYNLLFGKLVLKSLFEDYFDAANHFSTIFLLKPIEDRHVDLIASVSGPLDNKPEEPIVGNALFRWQSDADDPHTFTDLYVSSADPILLMRACAYYPKYGFGAFGIFPVLKKQRFAHFNRAKPHNSCIYIHLQSLPSIQSMFRRLWYNGSEIWLVTFVIWNHIFAIFMYVMQCMIINLSNFHINYVSYIFFSNIHFYDVIGVPLML